MLETVAPSTVTLADLTRCTTHRIPPRSRSTPGVATVAQATGLALQAAAATACASTASSPHHPGLASPSRLPAVVRGCAVSSRPLLTLADTA